MQLKRQQHCMESTRVAKKRPDPKEVHQGTGGDTGVELRSVTNTSNQAKISNYSSIGKHIHTPKHRKTQKKYKYF